MASPSLVASRLHRASPGHSSDGTAWRRPGTLPLVVVLAAQMMVVLDATIVNVALPSIGAALRFTGAELSWVLNAYILTFGGLLLLGARAGDLAGRRRVFQVGILLFSVASLAGGCATNADMLLAARAVQGVGGALAAPSALALLTALFPEGAERVRAIALFTTVSATGGALGLVAGGVLTEWAGWRWVMFVNVPIGLVAAVLGRRVLPETTLRRGRFDLAGAVLSTAGMTGLVDGLVQAANAGFSSPTSVVPLALGTVLLVAFVGNEARVAEPVLPLRLLTDATRSAANLARGLIYCGMYGMFFFLTQFLQDLRGDSPIVAGLSFLPMPLSVFLGSQLASRILIGRVARKTLMASGLALAGLGLGLAASLSAHSGTAAVCASLVLMGTGSGISFVSLTAASLAGVAPGDAGAASGLVNVSQQLGAALGVAVLVSVDGIVADHHALGAHLAAPVAALALTGMRAAFRVAVAFALLALGVVLVFVRNEGAPRRAVGDPESFAEATGIRDGDPELEAAS